MPQRLSANERADREYKRLLDQLRNDVRKSLESEGKQLLNDLRKQLTDDLKAAFNQSTSRRTGGTSSDNDSLVSISTFSNVISGILRLTAKPRTSSSTYETTRSQDAFSQFRLSRGQTMADASSELSNGERNL
jgi:5-methylcytosine-specific restriction endonuclease McrBC regulatory subunit McrC